MGDGHRGHHQTTPESGLDTVPPVRRVGDRFEDVERKETEYFEAELAPFMADSIQSRAPAEEKGTADSEHCTDCEECSGNDSEYFEAESGAIPTRTHGGRVQQQEANVRHLEIQKPIERGKAAKKWWLSCFCCRTQDVLDDDKSLGKLQTRSCGSSYGTPRGEDPQNNLFHTVEATDGTRLNCKSLKYALEAALTQLQGSGKDRLLPHEPSKLAETPGSSKFDRRLTQSADVLVDCSSHRLQSLQLSDEELDGYLPFVGWWEVDRSRSDDYSSLAELMKLSWAFRKALDNSKCIHFDIFAAHIDATARLFGVIDLHVRRPWSGKKVPMRRRDLRRGGALTWVEKTTRGFTFWSEWNEPLAGRSSEACELCKDGNQLHVLKITELRTGGKSVVNLTFTRSV